MEVKKFGLGVVALSLSLIATPAAAQLCVGVPLAVGQTSLAPRADFPDGGNIFGVRAANRLSTPITVGAAYSYMDPEVGDGQHAAGVDVALELPVAALADAGVGLCGVAGANVTFTDDRIIQVPFGVAAGAAFEVDSGISVAPFVVPQFQWTRVSFEGGSASDTEFTLGVGANLVVSNLFFGALINNLAGDGDAIFGVQAGIVF